MSESKECGGKDIIEKVKQYFYEDNSFSDFFERFANENCDIFDLEEEEMKLEYTELHNKFVSLLESKMEEFIVSQGSTVMELYDQIQEQTDKDADGDSSLFAQILVATTDFDIFVRLMQEARAQQLRK